MRKKRGSATFMVVMLLTVILILTFSMIPLALSNSKQSSMIYGRNKTYYTGEGSVDKILHYIDSFSERARISSYNLCFNGENINLSNPYVNYIYELYNPSDEDLAPKITYEEFKEMLINYYKHEFNVRINAFFNSSKLDSIKLVEREVTNEKPNIIYSWKELKDKILEDTNEKNTVEVFPSIDEDSIFYRFIPEFSNLSESKDEYSNISSNSSKLEPLSNNPIEYPDNIYEDFTLRETFYLRSLENKTERNLTFTIDFDPIEGQEYVKHYPKDNAKNEALKYGIIAHDNLVVQNNLTVESDVIIGGQGEPNKSSAIESVPYGGILVGADKSLFEALNVTDVNEVSENSRLTIKGNAFVGEEDSNKSIQGGFIETLGNKSSIEIEGNSYSHSIVAHESSKNGSINIKDSAFVADNVSLNGGKNKINISKHLVGFEAGDRISNNYLSSPSIVVNDLEKYNEGFKESDSNNLEIGGQVLLSGEGFVENLISNGRLFKTFETTAIYPNYMSYSNYLQQKGGMTLEEWMKVYNDYKIGNDSRNESLPISMLDKYTIWDLSNTDDIQKLKSELGVDTLEGIGASFMLSYFIEYKDELNGQYDMGKHSLKINELNINEDMDSDLVASLYELYRKKTNKEEEIKSSKSKKNLIENISKEINGEGNSKGLNISYFNYIMYANGNMYLTSKVDENIVNDAKDAIVQANIGGNIITSNYSNQDTRGIIESTIYPAIESSLKTRLNMEDVVSYNTLTENNIYDTFKDKKRLDRCFNWEAIPKGGININTDDVFVKISNSEITLNEDDLKNKKAVLVVSADNVVINTNSNLTINGSIMSKKNVITKGDNVKITTNNDIVKTILIYEDNKLQEFLKPGSHIKPTIIGQSKKVKTNIKVITRKELLS